MILLLRTTIFSMIFLSVETSIYLYHTNDDVEMEYFDCFYVESLWYCRRPTDPINLVRDNDLSACQKNGGIQHSFSQLKRDGIDVKTVLHKWKSSIERVEQYNRFLMNQSKLDGYLCQCSNESSFGKNCEYRFEFGRKLTELVQWQNQIRNKNKSELHYYFDIICYTTISCNTALLCLDWREICDGIQNCQSGYDEENCDILETNICHDDEYRCMNGMCIPDDYFLDGEFDCLDWSDELQYKTGETCPVEIASIDCDDHLCPPHYWSCGDGQCIIDRLAVFKSTKSQLCVNKRDLFFTCESYGKKLWTDVDGRCRSTKMTLTDIGTDYCFHFLRCSLVQGQNINCGCRNETQCILLLKQRCFRNLIPYPRQPLITSYLIFLYDRKRKEQERLPSTVHINGRIRCRNRTYQFNGTIPYQEFSSVNQIVNGICASRISYHLSQCHNEKESINICGGWNSCMSRTRIKDGFRNCLNGNDEIAGTASCNPRHRFRCSNDNISCLSVMNLGNRKSECSNNADESWLNRQRKLVSVKCNRDEKIECRYIRQLIEQSWKSTLIDQSERSHRISFRSYCDTFWDLDDGEDENIDECQRWWRCPSLHYRCDTGQCIDISWKNDSEWDCADGSDETVKLSGMIEKIQKISQVIVDHCDKNRSLSCLSTSRTSNESRLCFNRNQFAHSNRTNCPTKTNFICVDEQCIENEECDESFECLYDDGEYTRDDQYLNSRAKLSDRPRKEQQRRSQELLLELKEFPLHSEHIASTSQPKNHSINITTTSSSLVAFQCNRGIPINSINHSIVCFCPPHYYGDKCQYHADRLLILIDLRLSQPNDRIDHHRKFVVKLLILLFYNAQVLMTYEFHYRSELDSKTIIKKEAYLLYSHSLKSRQQRYQRFLNRSDILKFQPYSIQIEAYQYDEIGRSFLTKVWRYSIDFDYLPVYRFAKVLHWTNSIPYSNSSCLTSSCSKNEECYPLMNNLTKYVCLCKTNFTGPNCSQTDHQCEAGYCASGSLCKPNYRGLLQGNSSRPYCICPLNRYGDQCYVEHDACEPNPCLHQGKCFPSSQPDRPSCLCTDDYYDDLCSTRKAHIILTLNIKHRYGGVVVQFFDYEPVTLELILISQQVYQSFPRPIVYQRSHRNIPSLVLARFYSTSEDPRPTIYILLFQKNRNSLIDETDLSETNQCLHISNFLKHKSDETLSPFRYHDLCRNNRNLFCFYDAIYLCICVDNHTRVECFLYDDQDDQCDYCQSNGRCLRGDSTRLSKQFLCLCPSCYSGIQCQFNSKSFSFTIDQLLYTDLISHRYKTTMALLLTISLLGFLLALPNNLFSFLTFNQKVCLRQGIGHYLITLSIMNQINLALLLTRLIHIIFNLSTTIASTTADTILCKLLNFLLLSSSRMVFWLSSLIAIERVYTTVSMSGRWFKQPRIARRLIIILMIIIFASNAHEIFFYRSFPIANTDHTSICVFELPGQHQSFWLSYHFIINTFHSIVPFLINLGSVIIIVSIVVRKKMNTLRSKKRKDKKRWICISSRIRLIASVLSENKALVVGPAITLIPQLFSLPLLIFSLTLICEQIETSGIRRLLLACYLISFIPQLISFFLYISPSSFYSSEWRKTKMHRWLRTVLRHDSSAEKKVFAVNSPSRDPKKRTIHN